MSGPDRTVMAAILLDLDLPLTARDRPAAVEVLQRWSDNGFGAAVDQVIAELTAAGRWPVDRDGGAPC